MNAKHQTMKAALEVSKHVVRLWGPGTIGSALVCAYFSGNPWVTVAELSEIVPSISESQLRRRLDDLVKLDRARVRTDGRTKRYSAHPERAQRTYEIWVNFAHSLQNEIINSVMAPTS